MILMKMSPYNVLLKISIFDEKSSKSQKDLLKISIFDEKSSFRCRQVYHCDENWLIMNKLQIEIALNVCKSVLSVQLYFRDDN